MSAVFPETYEADAFLVKNDIDKVFFNAGTAREPNFIDVYSASIEPGTIVMWAGARDNDSTLADSVPDGWLLCDGRKVGKNVYPALYEKIKNIMENKQKIKYKVFARLAGTIKYQEEEAIIENLRLATGNDTVIGYIDVSEQCTFRVHNGNPMVRININRVYEGALHGSLNILKEKPDIDYKLFSVDDGKFLIYYTVIKLQSSINGGEEIYDGVRQTVFSLPDFCSGQTLKTVKGKSDNKHNTDVVGSVPIEISTDDDQGLNIEVIDPVEKTEIRIIEDEITAVGTRVETTREVIEYDVSYEFPLMFDREINLFSGPDANRPFGHRIQDLLPKHTHNVKMQNTSVAHTDDDIHLTHRRDVVSRFEKEFRSSGAGVGVTFFYNGDFHKDSSFGISSFVKVTGPDVIFDNNTYNGETGGKAGDLIRPHDVFTKSDRVNSWVRRGTVDGIPTKWLHPNWWGEGHLACYECRAYTPKAVFRNYILMSYKLSTNYGIKGLLDGEYSSLFEKSIISNEEETSIASDSDVDVNGVRVFTRSQYKDSGSTGGGQGINMTPLYQKTLFIIKT